MGKIPNNYDVVGKEAPSPEQGYNPFENPGIMPSTKDIPDDPGESATNVTTPHETKGTIPSGKKGSGY